MKIWGILMLIAVGLVIYGIVTRADRDDSGAIVGNGDVSAFQLRVGDCFDDIGAFDDGATEFSSVPGLPCSEPHDNEVFAVFDLDVPTFPGNDAIVDVAQELCLQLFTAFSGRDYDSSSLAVFPMYPTAVSWQQDDREVICAVYDMDENKLVGSAEGRGL